MHLRDRQKLPFLQLNYCSFDERETGARRMHSLRRRSGLEAKTPKSPGNRRGRLLQQPLYPNNNRDRFALATSFAVSQLRLIG